MQFSLKLDEPILARTPTVLRAMLGAKRTAPGRWPCGCPRGARIRWPRADRTKLHNSAAAETSKRRVDGVVLIGTVFGAASRNTMHAGGAACRHAESPNSMKTWIALLRGVNMVGKRRLRMQELVLLLEELGARDVKTFGTSGNAAFRHRGKNAARLAGRISAAIGKSRASFSTSSSITSGSSSRCTTTCSTSTRRRDFTRQSWEGSSSARWGRANQGPVAPWGL